ncbi:Na+/H+ antiporter subunit G [Halobacteriales archaeon QS_5_70_17]|jgi:multicomponent Na+:H+ antiporter subunit G|nr:MAG: Na+/H+ antiporter subunit G [Halobacteriales archaeon QS_5_70_17]
MISTPGDVLIVLLAAAGTFFGGVAAVGVLRLPDLYTRAHAASKSDTLGAVLSLAAVAITFGSGVTTVKTVFLLVFMFVTNPTAAHAITRAAHDQGIEPWTTDDRRQREQDRERTRDADRDRSPEVGAE